MSTTPKMLPLLIVFVLFAYFAIDFVSIGSQKIKMQSSTRNTTQTAMMRSVEEGGIRTKHLPRIDIKEFDQQFGIYGELNAGTKAMMSSYTGIYQIDRLKPYAAVQMGTPVEAYSMKMLNSDKVTTWHYPRHRVVFIWDQKN
ncbi:MULTISPECIES: hypothetical protein [Paenibacillus]|uniref:Uncharacterized protein n=2 Tax=Paenibacillus TaxID=44249 RepID=A0A7Y6BTF0_9BACL|nr:MULTISPECIES: hypothetical protein [Paenibacillus]KGP77787.1 hypothetical protein P364_0131475 [Paenibacillus sp. MAEPY2]KGP79566.1 hypothetical protein P363_0131040 [Paenibacillus sp. MAEPY1]MDN4603986.1 hypothetical protein [Paenibacillus vandeheii]NUU74682.1 hypothetical protein [Paenibacillus xylanilyticus]